MLCQSSCPVVYEWVLIPDLDLASNRVSSYFSLMCASVED